MFPLRLKVCFFQSVQTDRPPAITSSLARQTGPGRQCENICWMDLLTRSCFVSPFLYFFFLHTVYYVSDLMNLIGCHVTLSVSLSACLTFLSTVLFSRQQPFLELQQARALSVRPAQLAADGMDGLEKHSLVSRTHSSPAACILPHPAMDRHLLPGSATGENPSRLSLIGRLNTLFL